MFAALLALLELLTLPELHERAAENGWTGLVPAKSDPAAAVPRHVLESHCLQPSPFFVGSYPSLNGRAVETAADERGQGRWNGAPRCVPSFAKPGG